MKTALTSLTALLLVGIATAQTIFDFTAGTLSGSGAWQTWSQTVDGITCTATFNDYVNNDYAGAGSPALIDADGLYAGEVFWNILERLSYKEYGFTLTFSEDVRLKACRFGKVASITVKAFLSLAGGNVSALLSADSLSANVDYPFEIEALVPANTPIQSYFSYNNSTFRLAGITVEPETYVAPVIEPPAGSETGISRIAVIGSNSDVIGSNSKNEFSFALKNGELHAWGNAPTFGQERLFPGLESGVIDFVAEVEEDRFFLAQTAEGCAWFVDEATSSAIPQLRPLPADFPAAPDRWAIGRNFVLALKDGELYTGGDIAAPPAILQSGGITDIAGAFEIAFALKDGNVIAWGELTPGSLAGAILNVPAELTSGGQVDAIFANELTCAALVGDRIVAWGFDNRVSEMNNNDRLQSGVTDLILSATSYCAIKEDGSLAIFDYSNYRYVETIPAIVQQVGYTQLAYCSLRAAALLPSGRMVIWGNYEFRDTVAFGISPSMVPHEVNSLLYPQTVDPLPENPTAAELNMLQGGGLGIQWGSNTQYEVQTTTDILGGQWEPLPTNANNRFYRINPVPSN